MVIDKKKHSDKPRVNQGSSADIAEPNKIAASTHFDFLGKNLTPYGGLFPVATMLEKLVHAVVDRIRLLDALAQIESGRGSRSGHAISSCDGLA
jgi:hypothetical protein